MKRLTRINLSWFSIVYFILAAMSFSSLTAERSWLTTLSVAVVGLGALRGITMLPQLWQLRRKPLLWVCLGLVLGYGASMLVNTSYGWTENLKALCWLALCLLVLLPGAAADKLAGRRDYGRLLVWILIVYTGLAALAGLILMVLNVRVDFIIGIHVGVHLNRLHGLYADPNYGGILSAAAAVTALMLVFTGRARRGWLKALLLVHVLLQHLYIVFAYSRTAQVALIAGLVLALAYYIFVKRPGLPRIVLAGAFVLIICISSGTVRDAYNSFVVYENEQAEAEAQESGDTESVEVIETIERTGNVTTDLSNIRFAIWLDGVDAFRTSPILGITYRNIEPWFRDNRPESFMVNYIHGLNTFHNVFVDVLAGQGALGILLFLAAIVYIVIVSIRFVPGLQAGVLDEAAVYGLPLLVIMAGALMLSDIMYVNTPTTVLFWYGLGQWLSYGIGGTGQKQKILSGPGKECRQ